MMEGRITPSRRVRTLDRILWTKLQRLMGQNSEKDIGLGDFRISTIEVLEKDLGIDKEITDSLMDILTNNIPTMSEKGPEKSIRSQSTISSKGENRFSYLL